MLMNVPCHMNQYHQNIFFKATFYLEFKEIKLSQLHESENIILKK